MADIAGFNPLLTKLSLDISKDDFIARMEFENEKERERCLLYLDLKGVAYHTVLVNYIGLREDGMIQYKRVSNLYVYDKRIRNILYRYLSAFEEGIRAYICNHYCGKIDEIKTLSKSLYKPIIEGNSLSKVLEDQDFGHLVEISQKLPVEEKNELFGQSDYIKENLIAVKELRNAVSHHRMLFVYEDFNDCFLENGAVGNALINNIQNLWQLLNPYYKDFFRKEINHSSVDDEDNTFISGLPQKCILSF